MFHKNSFPSSLLSLNRHPSYAVLDGDLRVRNKFVGPCCGAESYYDCSADTARTLDATLSDYIDEVLAETGEIVESAFETPDIIPDVPQDPDMVVAQDETPPPQAECELGSFSDWSECSVTCGNGLEFRWRLVNGGPGCPAAVETRSCSMTECPDTSSFCVKEFGSSWEVKTVATGFDGPRDVAL